jgi:hypothetical protein
MANSMPVSMQGMDNSSLVTLGAWGDHGACREILKRHIMDVRHVSYDEAEEKFKEIAAKNKEGSWILGVPHQIGIGLALTAAFGSVPMVFDLSTAKWFNQFYVTADVPEPKDLETWLEVGSWTWGVSSNGIDGWCVVVTLLITNPR